MKQDAFELATKCMDQWEAYLIGEGASSARYRSGVTASCLPRYCLSAEKVPICRLLRFLPGPVPSNRASKGASGRGTLPRPLASSLS